MQRSPKAGIQGGVARGTVRVMAEANSGTRNQGTMVPASRVHTQ